MKSNFFIVSLFLIPILLPAQEIIREYRINGQYLNIPIGMNEDRQQVLFLEDGDTLTHAVIRIADGKPDYWVFKDVSAYRGKTLKMTFSRQAKGIGEIYIADTFPGQDSLYRESRRPQFHFSSRRGWNNDPNGLVWFDGEYHLFYQHNPFERNWQNMTWGHAVSPDLVHWTELNDVLYPDRLGTMFSGSAVIDKNNTAGWGKDAMVAAYTTDGKGEFQCIAWSNDRGRTFTKYAGNPVVGETRDPKVIWYEPAKEWVMALYKIAGVSLFTSRDLKTWTETCHINGFFECPEFYELPVDGNPANKYWVLTAASGTYMLGKFDGKTYSPEYGKYRTTYGSQYAAQTYNNTPDGKRIQIGWGQIDAKGMPFNQMMCFPTELTLRTTKEGIRLFSEPIPAIEKLHGKSYDLSGLSVDEANTKLNTINSDLLHVVARLESTNGGGISIDYRGNRYGHMDGDEINGVQTPSTNPGTLVFDVEMLIDRTSVESFYQHGRVVFVNPLKDPVNGTGLQILGDNPNIKIHSLKVYELKSIWK
jgi:fructan beta-fructosidase